jgi:mannosyltransferase OCH1-like enzyme
MKADLWRYCILKTEGGVYSDIDCECVLPVREWIQEQKSTFVTNNILMIATENHHDYCQWTLFCTKEHPAMSFVVQYILMNYRKNGIRMTNPHIVHETTGPGIFRKAINAYLGYPQKLSSDVFQLYNTNQRAKQEINRKGIYFLDTSYFREKYSKHLFGSQHFGDGYNKWIHEILNIQGRPQTSEEWLDMWKSYTG